MKTVQLRFQAQPLLTEGKIRIAHLFDLLAGESQFLDQLRVAPDADSEIIGLLRPGEVVQIVARNEDLTWWQVRDGTAIGWVNAQFVTLSPDVEPIRVNIAETE